MTAHTRQWLRAAEWSEEHGYGGAVYDGTKLLAYLAWPEFSLLCCFYAYALREHRHTEWITNVEWMK